MRDAIKHHVLGTSLITFRDVWIISGCLTGFAVIVLTLGLIWSHPTSILLGWGVPLAVVGFVVLSTRAIRSNKQAKNLGVEDRRWLIQQALDAELITDGIYSWASDQCH
ncbi:MAG: hypothetical protein AAFY08_10540 [Planctomycetota bacterium]